MTLLEQLQQLAPLAAAATAAPWRWELNLKRKNVELCGGIPQYDATVMGFARWGMGGASPTFNICGMVRADEFGAEVEGRRHHASWFQDVKHPDAALIVAARNLLTPENLLALCAGLAPQWVAVAERLPEAETPVLILRNGNAETGGLYWEYPGFEEDFQAYQYWDRPTDIGMGWEWDEVTHWMPLPAAPATMEGGPAHV